jgi:1-acyl-sn-glycerol-3-phosphate acyltransferase
MSRALSEPATIPRSARRGRGPPTRYERIVRSARLRWWNPILYVLYRFLGRCIAFCTLRSSILRANTAERPGGYLLACTHLSHLEPFIVGILIDRHIDMMSRIEFYGRWWSWMFLTSMGAFPVNRQGVPVSSIRSAISRAAAGRVVGIFPEGGVTCGSDSVCRGGTIKRGVCLIAYRADVPIVPCVVLGTNKLNCVGPWLPFRRARVWIAFGEPIWPDKTLSPRPARQRMAERLEHACVNLCRELTEEHGLADDVVP